MTTRRRPKSKTGKYTVATRISPVGSDFPLVKAPSGLLDLPAAGETVFIGGNRITGIPVTDHEKATVGVFYEIQFGS